jgi:RNA polymerase sigma-70 factor, ECF subfamily
VSATSSSSQLIQTPTTNNNVTQSDDAAMSMQERRVRRLELVANAHYGFVGCVLRRLGLSDAAADDATQQVFMVLARRLDEIEVGAEKSFLYRSATLVAREVRRSFVQRREQPMAVDSDGCEIVEDALAPSPEELAERKEARVLLQRALATLDKNERDVFVLFELEGMATADIAAKLGIPVGTCASRLRRAREQIREAVMKQRPNAPSTRSAITAGRGISISKSTAKTKLPTSRPPPPRAPERHSRITAMVKGAPWILTAEDASQAWRRAFWMTAMARVVTATVTATGDRQARA